MIRGRKLLRRKRSKRQNQLERKMPRLLKKETHSLRKPEDYVRDTCCNARRV